MPTRTDNEAFAFIAADGNVYLTAVGRPEAQRLTWDWDRIGAGEEDDDDDEAPETPAVEFRAPTWSPDGARLHCVAQEADGEGEEVRDVHYVVEPDRAESRIVFESADAHAIYSFWSPDGRTVVTMLLADEELTLTLVDGEGRSGGRARECVRGIPLFARWVPGRDQILANIGLHPDTAVHSGIVLIDGRTGQLIRRIHTQVGHFRTPCPHRDGDRFLCVLPDPAGGDQRVVVDSLEAGGPCELATLSGPAAFAWRPGGEDFALARAPMGPRRPFRELERRSLDGESVTLFERPYVSFFWLPRGDALVVAAFTEDPGVLEWWLVDAEGGDAEPLGRFVPSKEQAVMLNFFDQYADSHAPVSADGRYLLFAGLDAPAGASIPRHDPLIYTVDLAGSGKPEAVAEGSIATWRRGRA